MGTCFNTYIKIKFTLLDFRFFIAATGALYKCYNALTQIINPTRHGTTVTVQNSDENERRFEALQLK